MTETRKDCDAVSWLDPSDGGLSAHGTSQLDSRRGSSASFSLQQQLAVNQPFRKTSRLELVEGPAGVELREVEVDAQSPTSLRGTVNNIGHIPAQLDRHQIDKQIKTEVAHHSAAVEDTSSTVQRETSIRRRVPRDSIPAFILQHLHLALASPILYRVPLLVEKHSTYNGSAFLFVYVMVLLFIGVPMYVLEVTMAQHSSLGPVNIYRCLPLFTGVGVGMVATCFLTTLYCTTVITWSIVYITQSFYIPLPWESCPAQSEPVCVNITGPTLITTNSSGLLNITFVPVNSSFVPADYYFRWFVTHSLFNEGSIEFAIALPFLMLLVWVVVFLCTTVRRAWHTGVTSWCITITLYIMLSTIFLVGLNTDSGDLGIHRAFDIDFTEAADDLLDPTIWVDAIGQVLWSLGIAIALLIMNASHNAYTDSIIMNGAAAILANLFTTVLVVLAFFPFVGETHTDVAAYPGFFFVISSFALTYFGIPQLAAFVFYSTFALTLTYHVVALTGTVVCSLAEILQISWRRGFRRIMLGGAVCCVGFVSCFWFSSSEGIYLISCLDAYLPWASGTLFAMLEVVAFVHIYGTKKLILHLRDMRQTKTSLLAYWKYILPPGLLVIQIWTCVVGVHDPLNWMQIPTGREDLHLLTGFLLSVLPVVALVVTTVIVVCRFKFELASITKPQESWGPALVQHRKLYTQDVLRATKRPPWLVVQSRGDLYTESSRRDWIPTGYSYIPEGPAYVLLSSSYLDDMDEAKRQAIIRNFLRQRANLQRQQSEARETCCCACDVRRKISSTKKRSHRKEQITGSTSLPEIKVYEQISKTENAAKDIQLQLGVMEVPLTNKNTHADPDVPILTISKSEQAAGDSGCRNGVGIPKPEIILIANGLPN